MSGRTPAELQALIAAAQRDLEAAIKAKEDAEASFTATQAQCVPRVFLNWWFAQRTTGF